MDWVHLLVTEIQIRQKLIALFLNNPDVGNPELSWKLPHHLRARLLPTFCSAIHMVWLLSSFSRMESQPINPYSKQQEGGRKKGGNGTQQLSLDRNFLEAATLDQTSTYSLGHIQLQACWNLVVFIPGNYVSSKREMMHIGISLSHNIGT